jgi:hypothetical protein
MNSNREDMENAGGFIKEFLDRECEADAALRARLEALLAAHDQPNELLSKPIPAAKATMKIEFADASAAR